MTKKVILKDKNNEELIPYTSLATGAEAGRVRPDGTTLGVDSNGVLSVDQGLIDTVDGKISNCVLDIPQNIKLTLENNVVTLKAGSTLLKGGTVYTTYTLTADKTYTIPNTLEDGRYFVYTNATGTPLTLIQNKFGSGTTLPEDSSTYSRFFITTNKTFYNWSSAQNVWVESGITYPCAMIDVVGGVASFAKDSNGNDMIFNGAGFVGHHAFVYPNVKVLRPNEFNSDGSFRSINTTLNSLLIFEMGSTSNAITINGTTTGSTRQYYEVDNLDTSLQGFQYVKSENVDYFYNGSQYLKHYETKVVDFSVTGTTVNSFAVEQPIRLATTEMLDNLQDQVDINTSDIASKQDTLVSGTNIKTINSTTVLGNGNFALADQSLSNLDSTGQMIVDSQNGTISNCILEIPQNIKVTLENNVLTLKAGSIITLPGNTYTTVTTTQDNTVTISINDTFVVFSHKNGLSIGNYVRLNRIGSGSSLPADDTTYQCFYNSTDKLIYLWNNNQWIEWNVGYPLCVVKVENGNMSFAKDSNGNDLIFNGAGFVGHHVFVYPNVKVLTPNGLNTDGTLKSIKYVNNALRILELGSTTPSTGFEKIIQISSLGAYKLNNYQEVKHIEDMTSLTYCGYYVEENNTLYVGSAGSFSSKTFTKILSYTYNGTTVTDFTIRQPVRTATTEMTDKIQAQVDTNTTAISGKQDTLVSGTNIKTINSTTVLGNGNFALADQSLSNLDSNGQMIIDSQNGTISNCILDIPQNIKLEFSNGTVTLKAGSIITRTGSTYSTLTTTQDITWSSSSQVNKKIYLFASNSGKASGLYSNVTLEKVGSGNTLPANGDTYSNFYFTTDKIIYSWSNGSWQASNLAYPLAIIETDENGNITGFAKDSNGNDMIFNGAGFVGHHVFVYPNVSGLTPQKFNADGTLKSGLRTNTSLTIIEMNQGQYNGYNRVISLIAGNPVNNTAGYVEIENREEFVNVDWIRQYVKNENVIISKTSSGIIEYTGSLYPPQTPLLEYNYDGTTVTDFTIRQPVRTATTEMLNSATTKAKIYKGTYDATVQYYAGDIVKSGIKFFEALQDNINVVVTAGATWSQLSEDHKVRYYEQSDNVEYPIGLTGSSASGSGSNGYMNFTAQNKPTINASTGVITATGGVVGKTETAGDNSTKYATTAFVQTELANKFQVVTALPANPDANTFYFIVEEEENESEGE